MAENEFNPADYEVIDYLDNQRPRYMGQPIAAYEAEVKFWEQTLSSYFPNWHVSAPSIHHCGHCGNGTVRYISAVLHRPSGVNVVFGSECVHKLSFANADELKAAKIRARAEQGNARMSIWLTRCRFLEANKEVKDLIESNEMDKPSHAKNDFARDVLHKLNKFGYLSEGQVHHLLLSVEKDNERANRPVIVPTAPAPDGRQSIQGNVVYIKHQEGPYGTQFKMLVVLDSGAKVWSTIPAALPGDVNELKGRRVQFSATFQRSKDDQFFAFAKRPIKASLLD